MHNSLTHIFETIMPSVFLTFMLTLATCSRAIEDQGDVEPPLDEKIHEELIQIEDEREELHLQQQEMLNRLREIERQVENEK